MALIYFLLGGFLRRWYGGLFPDDKYKVLGNRALQTSVMIGVMLGIFVDDWQSWRDWLVSGVVALWLQFQFWSRGHGCAYDLSRGGYPDEKTIKRYNERWYHIPCDWMAEKRFFSFYGRGYDFTYMLLRYTCPMLPMILFDWKYILIGLSVAPIYAFCWQWSESDVWIFKLKGLSTATNLAEVICGGVFYAGCYLLGAL